MAVPPRTHYDVLGIPRDADASAVRTAWKLHVQAWHPDRFSGAMREEAERQACLINEAYTVLRDSGRRAAYDCRLAADQADARREAAPRPSARMRQPAPRAAAAPVGSPMPVLEPATLTEQAAAVGRDAWSIIGRHPRIFAAAATVWVIVFGGSIVMHAASGPSLPTSAEPVHAAQSVVASDEQTEDLEELAELARAEAEAADAEMAQLMREDAAIAEAEARAIAKQQAALAAQAAKRPAAKAGAAAAPPAAPRKIVRVMPTTTR